MQNLETKPKKDKSKDKEIFNTKNLSSLPSSLAREISKKKSGKSESMILSLFEFTSKKLTIEQIMVGIYRLHEEIKEKKWVKASIYRLVRTNKLKKTKTKKGETVYYV